MVGVNELSHSFKGKKNTEKKHAELYEAVRCEAGADFFVTQTKKSDLWSAFALMFFTRIRDTPSAVIEKVHVIDR